MSIAEVIAWKFNNQPGMKCETVNGSLKLVDFPGGIPSQAQQDTWSAEYDAFVASGGLTDKVATNDLDSSKAIRALFEVAFDHENRLRILEAKPQITKNQFKNALLTIWKSF